MCNIDGVKNTYCIIRINVAYKLSIHQELVVGACPVFKSNIHCARSEITAADSNLHDSSEFLTICIADLTCMYFCGKVSYLSLNSNFFVVILLSYC